MATLKRNLLSFFIALIILLSCVFAGVLYYIWSDLQKQNIAYHKAQAAQLKTADTAFFTSIDMLLGVIGNEILLMHQPGLISQTSAHPLLDEMLELNPSFDAFLFTKPDGTPLYTTSNLTPLRLANLINRDEVQLGLSQTIDSVRMEIGRTFYAGFNERWVVPVQKSIRGNQGETLGIMLALIEIGNETVYFSPTSLNSHYDSVLLIRGSDHYPQFYDEGSQWPAINYLKRIPVKDWSLLTKGVITNEKVSLREIQLTGEVSAFSSSMREANSTGAIVYDANYDLWFISQSLNTKIENQFLHLTSIAGSVYLLLIIALSILFRVISTAEQKKRDALAYQAFHDSLTGLYNRNYLVENIDRWINNNLEPFSMLYIDMDRFKNVNDNFGHVFGDIALKEISKRLSSLAGNGDLIIRQSGDEFLLLTLERNVDHLKKLGRGICYELSQAYELRGVTFDLGASVGIARYPEDGQDFDSLIRAADIALYEAKKQRNAVRFFAEQMLNKRQLKIAIESQLKTALKKQEIYVLYQPQVDSKCCLYGVETLARWENEQLGYVPPDQFIPVAEASGLMPQLGEFITGRSMIEMSQFQLENNVSFFVSVNISLRQFMHPGFMEMIEEKISITNFNKVKLVLEITENLFIDDLDYIRPLLQKLKSMGMQISMDDFGTGYSSLNILASLPIDELKIDKMFVDDILESDSAKNMIKNIIAIGRTYDMDIVAEGVETKEQFDLLKEYGCDRFQGYFFSEPIDRKSLHDFTVEHQPSLSDNSIKHSKKQ